MNFSRRYSTKLTIEDYLYNNKKQYRLFLQDKYDIAARAAPRCMAVQHIAAFWMETSRREPEAERAPCDIIKLVNIDFILTEANKSDQNIKKKKNIHN